jgi:hypothetical protein
MGNMMMMILMSILCCCAGAMRDEGYVEKANGFGGKVQRTFSGAGHGALRTLQGQVLIIIIMLPIKP